MKKNLFILILLAVLPLSVLAGDVNPGQALEIAKKFMKGKTFGFDQKMMDDEASERGFYAFNAEEGGFVLVSADDRTTRSVIGYSTDGSFDYSQLPENARVFFDGITDQIKSLTDADAGAPQEDNMVTATTPIEPLIKTKWSQSAPYYNLCPTVGSTHCVTGCVATAMAMILYYHKWPQKGNGVASYVWNGKTLTQDLSKSTYDYNSMTTTYSYSSSGPAADAVAVLMRDCGYAVGMSYGTGGSSARVDPEILYYDFGYKMGTLYKRAECGLTNAQWDAKIMTEIKAGRPILYSGHGTGGHQFILDGCDSNGLFHFNFGWGGSYDSYYGTTSVRPAGDNYSDNQEMIVGVEPNKSWTPATTIPGTKARFYGYYDSKNAYQYGDPTIKVNESIKIIAGPYPNTATNKALEWGVFYGDAVSVSNDGTVTGVKNGSAVIAARPKGSSGYYWLCEVTVSGTAPDPEPAAVSGLKLSKNTLGLTVGGSQKLTYTLTPSNAANKDVSWTTSNSSIASIASDGTVKGVGPGTATITLTSQENASIYDQCKVTVTPVQVTSVKLNKTSLTFMYGDSPESLVCTIAPNEAGKGVTWTSSDPAIASVNSSGTVTPHAIGTATITCASTVTPSKKATCKVTVKTDKNLVTGVKLDQTTLMIKDNNEPVQLKATVTPDNAYIKSTQWESSNPAVATVDASGNVRGQSVGTATITCFSSFVPAKKATCKVTVVDKNKPVAVTGVKLDKTSLTIKQYSSEMLYAVITPEAADNKMLTWEISNPAVATITPSGKTLLVEGKEIGTATITCTSSNGKKATCKLTVKDWRVPVSSVKLEKLTETLTDDYYKIKLNAIIGPDDATDKSVNWSVNCPEFAYNMTTSSSQAEITFRAPGTWTVTCTSGNGKKATYKVTWKSNKKAVTKVTLSKTSLTIDDSGDTYTVNATVTPDDAGNKLVSWSCSDESVIGITSVSPTQVTFKGFKAGTATITCTSAWTPSKKATCKVTVKSNKKPVTSVKLNKTTLALAIGGSYDLTPTVLPEDAYSKAVTWTSSNTDVATVSGGKVTGVSAGSAVITCQSWFTPAKKATCKVTVKKTVSDDESDEVTRGVIENDDETFAEGADEAVKAFDVYNLQGRKVASQVTSLDGLPKGIYIIDGKKVVKR